jgi:hypothetical protein
MLLFVIPGRAKHEPGIHRAAITFDEWIPGSRQEAHPGMTSRELAFLEVPIQTASLD